MGSNLPSFPFQLDKLPCTLPHRQGNLAPITSSLLLRQQQGHTFLSKPLQIRQRPTMCLCCWGLPWLLLSHPCPGVLGKPSFH